MTFLFPVFFWALAGLVPLVAIYFLKVRPRRKPITTFFLWDAVLDQKRATRLWQRLRDVLSLLLMLAAFVAVVLALTAPRTTETDERGVLILVDHSASMNARDGGSTRLVQAKNTARRIIRGLNPEQQAAVATMADELAFQCHLTTQPRECLEAIDRITPTQTPLRVELLDQIVAQVDVNAVRLLLLSDGCAWNESGPDEVELYKIGRPGGNVGIVGCDLQRRPGQNQLDLWLQLASSFEESREIELWLRHDQGTQKMITTTVEPGLNEPQVWPVAGADEGPWTLSLSEADDFADDDVAYLVVPARRPIHVAIQSAQSYYPSHTVQAFAESGGDLVLDQQHSDVTLSVSTAASASRLILFGPQGEQPWWRSCGEALDRVMPKVLLPEHPILRHCDLQDVPFVGARQLEAPDGAVVLAENPDGVPLLYTVRQDDRAVVVFNMDPEEAQFFFSAWFPVSVYNSARVLMGQEGVYDATYASGRSVGLPSTLDQDLLEVAGPQSDQVTSWAVQQGAVGPLTQTGFYRWPQDEREVAVGVSLLSDADSRINRPAVLDSHEPIAQGWPLSLYCALLALALLILECWLYHQRKVG